MTAPDYCKLMTLLYVERPNGNRQLDWHRSTNAAWENLSGIRNDWEPDDRPDEDFDPDNAAHRQRLIEDLDCYDFMVSPRDMH